MADIALQIMRLAVGRDVDAKGMRRLGLTDAGNIVLFALDREQRAIADRRRIDRLSAMGHLAFRKRVAHEHGIDRLQIKFRGQIHHREIVIVELAMLLGGIAVALDQMEKKLLMGIEMPVQVHADEAIELQKPRIDVAHHAGIAETEPC